MNRRLLPYEYQLIEALGVSKEEYLEFVALQEEYKDPKAGTALDIRGVDGGATVAIVLTVVGILFQVGAALLAPKPNIPDFGADNKRRNRQQRFSPSFGFNGAPELAAYGDPVNLVYTNKEHNPDGGVRAAGSLVWSAIDNFGSAQFMQLLFVIGASRIIKLDANRTAFGSLALSEIDPSIAFLFYKDEKFGRPPRFKDKIYGSRPLFPERLRRVDEQEVCQITTPRKNESSGTSGFSQAYSPTTSSVLGVFDPIPVNVEMYTRNGEGEEESAPIGVVVDKNDWSSADHRYKKGNVIQVKFESSDYAVGDKPARSLARDFRRQAVDSLDFGSTYMLGSASFRLSSFADFKNPDDGIVYATFTCIKSGFCPSADYDKTKQRQEYEKRKQQIERHQVIINNTFTEEEDDANPPVSNGEDSEAISYVTIPFSTDFTLGGAKIEYDFEDKRTVSWTNELDEKKTKTINPAGSLDYTKYLESEAADDFPTIKGGAVIEELDRDIASANKLIGEIQSGDYDDSNKKLTIPDRDGKTSPFKNVSLEAAIDADLDKDLAKGKLKRLTSNKEKVENNLKNATVAINKNLRQSNKLKKDAFVNNDAGKTRKFPNSADLRNEGLVLNKGRDKLTQRLNKIDAKLEGRRQQIIGRNRSWLIKQLQDSNGVFTDINGNRYGSGGIAQMQKRKDEIPNKKIPDTVGIKAIGAEFSRIKRQKEKAMRTIKYFLNNWEDLTAQEDNNFFVKALVKAESASYETISEVDHVKFSIKSKLYRKVSGRQKKYGETDASKKYSLSDNGTKGRQAFFRFSYKKASETEYNVHDVLVILRHGSEVDTYSDFNFIAPTRDKYAFRLEPVYDVASEIKENGQTIFAVLENHNRTKMHNDSGPGNANVWWNGDKYNSVDRHGFPALEERGPKLTNEWDMFSVHTDTQLQFSFDNGPELALTAVTEQQIQETHQLYRGLSILSLNMFAGKGVQDLRNVTAFVTQGKQSYRVEDFTEPFRGATPEEDESTSFAPDIFVDTVLDKENGIGKYAPSAALDQESLKLAKLFCQNNNLPVEEGSPVSLFMDGVIADNSAWREFWVSTAPFSLLEFARKNGKETLIPALPTRNNGKAAENDGRPISLTISALFTTGNILEDSYKEEFLDYGASTQDLIASIVYREESTQSIFQRKRTVDVRRADTSILEDTAAIRETFDVSGFVTTRQQAILFGKLLVNQRRFIRRGIEFKTFPSINPVEPGAFIYVDIGLTKWERTSSGVIGEGGALNSPLQDSIRNNNYNFLIYDRDASKVSAQNSVAVQNGVASSLARKTGSLYVMGIDSGKKRVFRITEVELDEEGEVTVRAVEYPCDDEDRALIADFRPTVNGAAQFEVS